MDINISELTNFLYSNILFFAIGFAAILGKLKESSKRNILSAWVMFVFGTFFHELAHFIVSLITFGKPVSFSIIPKRVDGGIVLGSVKSANMRWYNTIFISLAPLLLIPLAYFVYLYFFQYFDANILNFFIYIFMIVSLLFAAIPSSVDIKNIFTIF